jgi:uncharacterized protein (DUF302 family)
MTVEGLVTIASPFGAEETTHRLETAVQTMGMTVFARIDHALGARQVGLDLRPTTLLIFGNARAGTVLMKAIQSIGIDLPLKALVWEDANGKIWLSYNNPEWLAARHGVGVEAGQSIAKMSVALDAIAARTTAHI